MAHQPEACNTALADPPLDLALSDSSSENTDATEEESLQEQGKVEVQGSDQEVHGNNQSSVFCSVNEGDVQENKDQGKTENVSMKKDKSESVTKTDSQVRMKSDMTEGVPMKSEVTDSQVTMKRDITEGVPMKIEVTESVTVKSDMTESVTMTDSVTMKIEVTKSVRMRSDTEESGTVISIQTTDELQEVDEAKEIIDVEVDEHSKDSKMIRDDVAEENERHSLNNLKEDELCEDVETNGKIKKDSDHDNLPEVSDDQFSTDSKSHHEQKANDKEVTVTDLTCSPENNEESMNDFQESAENLTDLEESVAVEFQDAIEDAQVHADSESRNQKKENQDLTVLGEYDSNVKKSDSCEPNNLQLFASREKDVESSEIDLQLSARPSDVSFVKNDVLVGTEDSQTCEQPLKENNPSEIVHKTYTEAALTNEIAHDTSAEPPVNGKDPNELCREASAEPVVNNNECNEIGLKASVEPALDNNERNEISHEASAKPALNDKEIGHEASFEPNLNSTDIGHDKTAETTLKNNEIGDEAQAEPASNDNNPNEIVHHDTSDLKPVKSVSGRAQKRRRSFNPESEAFRQFQDLLKRGSWSDAHDTVVNILEEESWDPDVDARDVIEKMISVVRDAFWSSNEEGDSAESKERKVLYRAIRDRLFAALKKANLTGRLGWRGNVSGGSPAMGSQVS